MSGVKHTPGPWEVDDSGCVHVMGDEWNFIPLISPFREGVFEGDKEALANARLIAAAPDLLETGAELQAARKAQNLSPSAANALRVRHASDAFDAAIARARGEQDGGGE